MKKIALAALALMCSSEVFCQLEKKMRDESVVAGVIIKNGKEVPGYIKKMGTTYLSSDQKRYSAPWEFQKNIRFIPQDVFEKTDKIKNKLYQKYDAKSIEGYKYNGDSLMYQSVKYSDMSAVGTGMIAKKKFMRKILEDKISIYYHFQTPPPIGEVSDLRATYIEYAEPESVYQIGDGKLKLVNSLNVEKELADCPAVVTKYKNNEYKAVGDENSNSGGNKLLNKVVFRDAVRYLVIEDYNSSCK